MIQISPQQKIWTTIRMLCVNLGIDTYDYIPDGYATYPYVFIGEQFKQNIREHKDHLNGRTQVTIHVWHNDRRKRGSVSGLMADIERAIYKTYGARVLDVNTEIMGDNSTGSDLLHGIVEVNIKY